MQVITVTQPEVEPVTLAEVWAHLRIDPDGSPPSTPLDSTYERNIKSAREDIERRTHRSMVVRTLRLLTGSFPEAGFGVPLLQPPVRSVSAVRYYDGSNVLQEVASADWYLAESEVPELRFVSGFSVPTLYDRPDALRIDYVAGYPVEGSPPSTHEQYVAGIPTPLKEAVLLQVEVFQANTSPNDRAALDLQIKAICAGFEVHALA